MGGAHTHHLEILTELEDNLQDAERLLNSKLNEIYPEGTELSFWIQHNQKVPSTGVVLGYSAPYLRVRLRSKKQDVKDVHFGRICEED